jgi:hypothetical protein
MHRTKVIFVMVCVCHSDVDAKFPASPQSVARFLKATPGLRKTPVGEFLSKGPADLYPFNAEVLREYVDTFDFSGRLSAYEAMLCFYLRRAA